MPTWDATQYLQFADERTLPCRDLIARINLKSPRRVIDLGCGPGNSTQAVANRWPDAEIAGLDNSAAMIEKAARADSTRLWIMSEIRTWAETERTQSDLVFSNAALQWVDDHAAVFPLLLDRVAPQGALAVQVPCNQDAPAQSLIRQVAASAPWQKFFAGAIRNWHVHEAPFYYDLLAFRSAHVDLWLTEYIHQMPSAEAIVEWYKGTGLRPFLDALPSDDDRNRFLADYLALIRPAYPPRGDGKVLFPFRRLFIVAYR
jgi:trans-aconitate 2-methyltransferase